MSTMGLRTRNFGYWLFFTAIVLVLSVFFVLPFIKHRNFVNFLNDSENGEDLRGSIISVAARYEGGKENFFDYNGDKRIHPGSNFKLFTAVASLNYLKPDFAFKTKLYVQSQGSRIDLILVGGGDPSFRQTDFVEFVDAVKKTGRILGNVYYDDSYFQGEKYGPAWNLDWRDQYFAVPITGLQIEDNLLNIRAGEIGDSGKFGIETRPIENYSQIIDKLTYFKDPNEMKLPVTAAMDDQGVVTLVGDTMKELPFNTSAAMKDPSLFTAIALKQELLKAGLINSNAKVIQFKGDIANQKLIYEHKSKPLSDIVFQMLKFSKNNYAETLVRTLGKEVGTEGSQKEGVTVLNDFFAEIGISDRQISAFDGSGLSPSTRVTGNAILELFDFVDTQDWKTVFWDALPESQKDGTLKYRFDNAGLQHQVIGKTGTHEFASSLSGKILREGGHNILFSVHIYNYPYSTEESVVKVRPVIDKIIALLDKQF